MAGWGTGEVQVSVSASDALEGSDFSSNLIILSLTLKQDDLFKNWYGLMQLFWAWGLCDQWSYLIIALNVKLWQELKTSVEQFEPKILGLVYLKYIFKSKLTTANKMSALVIVWLLENYQRTEPGPRVSGEQRRSSQRWHTLHNPHHLQELWIPIIKI